MDLEEITRLQKSWCSGKSQAIQNGARESVVQAVLQLESRGIPLGTVCEIGPQHGYGLEEWNRHTYAFGLEPVPEFLESCLLLNLDCYNGFAEGLDLFRPDELGNAPDKRNYYLRDTAEHFYDRTLAFENILESLDDWIYVSIPIEPEDAKDAAHMGQFRDRSELDDLLSSLTCVWEDYIAPTSGKAGRLVGIWRKTTSESA